jgi:CheY-like chemotaxis protein
MIPATSLVQLVRALVTNAADSMVEGGVVRLTLSAVTAPGADNRRRSLPIADSSQEFFRLSVEDSGEGIAESDRPRLFEPYYSTKHGAAGLGLTVTRQTLAEYGGGLDVASTVGEGTVVSAYIPVYGIGHRRAQRAHTSGDAARFRVLVMDDDERVRSSVREMLQRIGYRVTLSADGHEAIYLYEKALEAGAPFDLCIFDSIVAGGLSGPEAMARIHQSHPEASGVLMCAAQTEIAATSMPAYHLSESGDESPFLAVLYKPFGYHAVAETVSHALAQRSL